MAKKKASRKVAKKTRRKRIRQRVPEGIIFMDASDKSVTCVHALTLATPGYKVFHLME